MEYDRMLSCATMACVAAECIISYRVVAICCSSGRSSNSLSLSVVLSLSSCLMQIRALLLPVLYKQTKF